MTAPQEDAPPERLSAQDLLRLLDEGGLDLIKITNTRANIGKGPAIILAELINRHLNQ